MEWSYKIENQPFKIVRLQLEAPSKWDPDHPAIYSMFYQSWTWGACSCATLWGWMGISQQFCTDEALAGFIHLLLNEAQPIISSLNPHRAFAQVPAVGRDPETGENGYPAPFFEYLMERVYSGMEPVYQFRNRSHASTMQRLYDLDTDQMLVWLENYNAEQKAKQDAANHSGNGTIILGNGAGQRPVAAGEYFR